MVYSLSPGGQAAVYKSDYVSNMTNQYRVTGDTWDKVKSEYDSSDLYMIHDLTMNDK